MIQLVFDPIGTLIEVANELFPECAVSIFWSNDLKGKEGQVLSGMTVREKGSEPVVVISLDLPLHAAVETLAHELAHVVVDEELHEHGPKWYRAFGELSEKYVQRVQENASQHADVDLVHVGEEEILGIVTK